jgi:hypothetical protein
MPDPSHSGSATATPVPTTIILTPSYWVPVGVAIVGLGLGLFTPWLGVLVFVFAVFLAVQATILRLHFTATTMELYRQGQLLRQFPYSDWLNWQIFWTPVPILFYFREVKSIHFVPIVFDPAALKACLALRCPLT